MKSENNFDLEKYLNDGIEDIVKATIKATFKNPKGSIFFAKFANSAKKARERRKEYVKKGEHIPSFLIASITQKCNLNCAGCYAHFNNDFDEQQKPAGERDEMSAEEWGDIFAEAVDLGVSAILLAGGEPLIRKDVIETATKYSELLFPIFTNATILDKEYFNLFDKHRNLIPVVSIEGDETSTDARRGKGVFDLTAQAMEQMKKQGLLFGASITVTSENLNDVTEEGFLKGLHEKGCRVVFYIEYVPVDNRDITLSQEQISSLDDKINSLRQNYDDLIIISFPGDEKEAGGCLAAGRGFIHINASGSAEPCPFSPFSDTNVKDVGLRNALKSKLFQGLKETGLLQEEHTGGCVLFQKRAEVEALMNAET